MERRVVVTGIGCITPLGSDLPTIWQGLTAGRSAVGPLTLFDASGFPSPIAAEVRDWDIGRFGLNPQTWQHCPRQTQFALAAAKTAVEQSGIAESAIDPVRLGVYLGCGELFGDFERTTDLICGSLTDDGSDSDAAQDAFNAQGLQLFQPEDGPELEPAMAAVHIAGMFDAQGPNANCIAACASSTQAIGQATELIRAGRADAMLAGGAHSMIHPFGLTGFQRLSALSSHGGDPQQAVRPFDRERDGIALGEGGAVLVLEELDRALQRGADIWGEITGYGSAQDAYRITDSHPEGRGTQLAIHRALDDAQFNTDQIDYINAHGTATVVNDKVETAALKSVFKHHAPSLPISSSKSMIGHTTTACGAIETAFCLMTLRSGVIAPTINYETPDPDCDLDYVPNAARDWRCQHVLNNNIGFGGQNAALIVSQYEPKLPASTTRRAA
jgi:3-oxoacyl-[acyl-carrier-protein] synthase II